MPKLLGIDIGTSGCKALLIDERGNILRQATSSYPLSFPQPLWSEQNPADWWRAVLECIRDIGEESPDAIGLSGQMHGSVFLDESDDVIRPAILWNDQRTSHECAEIDRRVGPELVRAITCNPPMTGFQAPKILWLRTHEPENYYRVRSILLPKDYIRMLLSGIKASEVSDASGTGLFDVSNRRWSHEMMAALELEGSFFPEVLDSNEATSHTRGVPGLRDGSPIVGGGGDQAAGAVGTGAVTPGVISVSLGTSGVVFTSLDSPEYDRSGAAHTFCHANEAWHVMGVELSCGGALAWFRDAVGCSYEEIASRAETVAPGCDGLTFLPYLSGERCPHNDPFAKASFSGLSLAHNRAHLGRAVFEGVSFGLLDSMNLLLALGAQSDQIRVTGGGAKSAFWMQMLADMFQRPSVDLEVDEGPALGAAILAGVGAGVWSNVQTACEGLVRVKSEYQPAGVDYSASYRRFKDLYTATRDWNRS
jgi:xylulokinase